MKFKFKVKDLKKVKLPEGYNVRTYMQYIAITSGLLGIAFAEKRPEGEFTFAELPSAERLKSALIKQLRKQ